MKIFKIVNHFDNMKEFLNDKLARSGIIIKEIIVLQKRHDLHIA